jgi:hypothetical protein
MKNPWLLPAAALLVGGAGGFIAGKSGDATADSSSGKVEAAARSARPATGSSTAEAQVNRSRSLDDILRTPGQNGRIQALLDYYQNLSPEQLEEEAAKLEGMPMNERIMASLLLFGRWAEVDPHAALAYSDKIGMGGMFVKPTILQSWASTDPASAAKYFAENPREFQMMGMGGMGGRGGSGASVIASEWAKTDPQAALAWAQSLKGRDKDQAMTSVVRELASTDPQKAVAMAATMDGEAQEDAYASIATQWGAKDFDAAEAWVKSLPASLQEDALARAIGSLANSDPVLASKKVDSMESGDAKERAITRTVDAWSRENPAQAAAWLIKQGDDVDDDAVRGLVRNWATQDDKGVLAFIQQQPAGDLRDEATQSYIWSNRSDNYQNVLSLAESIEDNNQRQRAIAVSAERWMQTDPDAAKAYIQQSPYLSDQAKRRLEQGRGFRGPGGQGGPGGGRRNR